MIDESPYGEPLDAIRPQPNLGSSGEYASIQDVAGTKDKRPDDGEYASVFNSRSPKKKPSAVQAIFKKKKSKVSFLAGQFSIRLIILLPN